MYWLRRPPYSRWMIATAVLAIGLLMETRPPVVVAYPHVAGSVAAGQSVESSFVWRDVPAGVLPAWQSPVAGFAVADIADGTPLLPELVTPLVVPDGWWSVSLRLPRLVVPGTRVRVSIESRIVEGIVAGEPAAEGFEMLTPVAFTADDAALVASAAATNALVVMIGS